MVCPVLNFFDLLMNLLHIMGITYLAADSFFWFIPWFDGTECDKLYQMDAAFITEVNEDLDTLNFEKFEESDTQTQSSSRTGPWRKFCLFSAIITNLYIQLPPPNLSNLWATQIKTLKSLTIFKCLGWVYISLALP
ncbi:unnamed protein product [Prunus brigantina]